MGLTLCISEEAIVSISEGEIVPIMGDDCHV